MNSPDVAKIREYLLSQDAVVAAYLFGSFAAGGNRRGSDIDIAVLLDDEVDRKDYGGVKLLVTVNLMKALSYDAVDVVILNAASPLLSHEVIKKGTLLFSRDEERRAAYVAKATMRYLDTIHLRKVQDRILHEKIRRGDFGHFKGSRKYSIEAFRKGASDSPAVG
jgi:predicted nucleotidyltransferase